MDYLQQLIANEKTQPRLHSKYMYLWEKNQKQFQILNIL